MNRVQQTELSESKRRLLELYLRGKPGQRTAPSPIARRATGAPIPLSLEQELLWIHSHLAPGLPLYNDILTVRRTGPLDVGALERSLAELLRRHEAWRSTFRMVDGVAQQIVGPPPRISLPIIDLSTLAEAEREPAAVRFATAEAQRPIDLINGPLVRANLVRMAESEYRVYITLHQIINDGISTYSVFFPELIALYEAFASGKASPLPELPVQYGDYASWQREADRPGSQEASLEYWRRQLADRPAALEWPTDYQRRSALSFHGRQLVFPLSANLTEGLKRLSQRAGTTLYATLLAAFKVLLHRHTGQEDIVVGTAISTRRRPELENLLGVFLNTVALRTRVTPSLTFRQLLTQVKNVAVDGLSHGDVPFHRLVRDLQPRRDPGSSPLFQALFVLEPKMAPPAAGWDLTQMDVDTGVARVDLSIQMDDRADGLLGHIRYSTDLWREDTITRLVEHYKLLLEGIVLDPEQVISAIPMLTQEERVATADARELPNASSVFQASELEQSIAQRFAKQVEKHGHRLAVQSGTAAFTYAELDRAADSVAHGLRAASLSSGARVGLLLDHDAAMPAGLLGVLKGDFSYVPLDATHPPERLRRILADASAAALLTSTNNLRTAQALASSGMKVLELEELLRRPSPERYGAAGSPERLAYLLYTSGSTGLPKGVAQNQRNVLHFIGAYTDNLRLHAEDRLTLLAPYGVDAAVMDIFGALLNGATLCPIDVRSVGLGGMCERLARDAITVYHSTPTLYRQVVRVLATRPPPESVRLVVLGGEEVQSDDVNAYQRVFSRDCVLVNCFGQTESSISLQHLIDKQTLDDRRRVAIGRAAPRTAVALLSADGRPGQVFGEIAIRSRYLAVGYWQNPDLTAKVFLEDPTNGDERIYKTGDMGRLLPDGNIEFCGRRDLQQKILGYRVEIGEIEAALALHPAVKEAAAAVWDIEGEPLLAAYYAPRAEPAPSPEDLRRFLLGKLPTYMIPSRFVRLDALPLTSSRKLNRLALPAPDLTRLERDFVEPRDAVEQALVEIWRDALGLERVSVRDDFFDLGGHSLTALRMMEKIEREFGINLPLATLFASPTVEQLAEVVGAQAVAHDSTSPKAAKAPANLAPPFSGALARKLRTLLRR